MMIKVALHHFITLHLLLERNEILLLDILTFYLKPMIYFFKYFHKYLINHLDLLSPIVVQDEVYLIGGDLGDLCVLRACERAAHPDAARTLPRGRD